MPPDPQPLLSSIEDAGLNASAPRQQRWLDGWLMRFSPGKAKRARCINALAPGRLPPDERLALARAAYAEAGLPLLVRITPFTQPPALDGWLEGQGYTVLDDTRVMVATSLPAAAPSAPPPGLRLQPLAGADFAEAVGRLRGSTAAERRAHAERLAAAPVPLRGFVLRRIDGEGDQGAVVACGQFAREGALVGLYDVHTDPAHRGQGLASWLCERLLAKAASEGASIGYLQVDAGNEAARRIYRRLGFADAYAYHYRQPS